MASVKKRNGFSLVELMVVVTIFGFISALMIANFNGNQKTQNLRTAAAELVSKIREAQGLTYGSATQNVCTTDGALCGSGSVCDPSQTNCMQLPVTSYGIALDTDGSKTKYALFADHANASVGSYSAGEALVGGIYTLPRGITFQSVSATPIVFSYTGSPFGACGGTCIVTIVLANNINQTRTITFHKQTGALSIQ
jgi:prepilin-type N-terminal cleavage/methylation domain-containing protein